MFDTSSYSERASMHEELARSTTDMLAQRMHRAMAAEFRRRAGAADDVMPLVEASAA